MDSGVCGAVGGMIGKGSRSYWNKPSPVPLSPPQIPYDLSWVRSRAAAVWRRRLTVWVTPRPFSGAPSSTFKFSFHSHPFALTKCLLNANQLSSSWYSKCLFYIYSLQISLCISFPSPTMSSLLDVILQMFVHMLYVWRSYSACNIVKYFCLFNHKYYSNTFFKFMSSVKIRMPSRLGQAVTLLIFKPEIHGCKTDHNTKYQDRVLGSFSQSRQTNTGIVTQLCVGRFLPRIFQLVFHQSVLEIREYGRRDPSRWPRGTLHPQKLALTSPTSCGRSVGIVSLRTKATEFSLVFHQSY
jgi:hypothetical protein